MMEVTAHAAKQIAAKGFDEKVVRSVWEFPDYTYPSHRYPDQEKRCGQGIVLCCDKRTGRIITVFINGTETDLRSDQKDKDALRYGRTRARMR